MKVFLLSFLFIFQSYAQDSCELNSYAQIIKINKMIDDSIIKKSTCSHDINTHFVKLIMNANGKLNGKYLTAYFKNEFNKDVSFTPSLIEIKSISELIEQKYKNGSKVVKKVSSLYGQSSYNLSRNDLFSIECNHCNTTGNKNIKIVINKKSSWVSAEILMRKKVFKATRSLSTMTAILTKDDFLQASITGKSHSRYFSDIENIQFYRLNKHVGIGETVRVNDLSPKILINYGQRVKITIKNKNINLKTIGIAKKNGRIGDFIELETPKTKKIILGKVVGFNKAVVEL